MDRESESIEHIQNIGSGCSVSRKYKVEGGVESLLEDMDAESIFDHIEGNPENVVVTAVLSRSKRSAVNISCTILKTSGLKP